MDTTGAQKYLLTVANQVRQTDWLELIPTYSSWWGGAGVVVRDSELDNSPSGFYSPPRAFISPYPNEMTWVFGRAQHCTEGLPEVWAWKVEYYGNLANAGNAFVAEEPDASAERLALAVLLEALLFMEKLSSLEGVPVLPVAFGNEIADDFQDRQTSWIEVKKTWTLMGLKIP